MEKFNINTEERAVVKAYGDIEINNNLAIDNNLVSKIKVISVSYENLSWNVTLKSMIMYMLWPLLLPIIILLSKILKRKIEL